MADGVEIRVSTPGSETLGEMRAEIKALKKELQGLVPGTKEFANQSQIISTRQDKVNDALRQGWSESAKMKDAYFKTGLEVRQLVLSSGVLDKQVGKLADTFSSSVINALQLRRALSLIGLTLSGGTLALIAAAAAALTYFVGEANKAKDAVVKLTAELSLFNKVSTTLGDIAKKRQSDFATVNELLLRQASILRSIAFVESGGKGLGAVGRILAGKMSLDDLRLQLIEINREVSKLLPGMEDKDVLPPKTRPGFSPRNSKNEFLESRVAIPAEAIEAGRRQQQQARELVATLRDGARTFSSTLINALVEGRNIAQSIGLALLGVLVNVGTNYLTGGISSLLGIGTSMGGGSATPVLSAQRSGGGGGGSFTQVIPLVKNDGLYVMVKRGENTFNRRSY